jgi:hypothetical protein
MGDEDKGGTSLAITLDFNKLFKDTVDLVRSSKPTSRNNTVLIDQTPKGRIRNLRKQFCETSQRIEDDNLVSDGVQSLLDYFEVKQYKAGIGVWFCYVSYDLCEVERVGKWFANLKTWVIIKHQVPGTDLDVTVSCESQLREGAEPEARLVFHCRYSGATTEDWHATCFITGPRSNWKVR